MPTASIAFIDFEASSLSPASYPIEVGWAMVIDELTIITGALLIRPVAAWTDWASEAEHIHGISREELVVGGVDVRDVVTQLDDLLGNGIAYADAPSWDARWADRLYAAAGLSRPWQIENAVALLRSAADTPSDLIVLQGHLDDTRRHRADADANALALAWVELRRRSLARKATDTGQ